MLNAIIQRTHRALPLSAFLVALLFSLPRAALAADTASEGCPATGARVFLYLNGTVSLNGKAVPITKLKDALTALKPKPTVVCYSREGLDREPPSAMTEVMDAIIAMKLPVGMFTDSTFKTFAR